MCTKKDCVFRLCHVCGEKRIAAKDKAAGVGSSRTRNKRTKIAGNEPKTDKNPCGHDDKCFRKETNKAYSPQWRLEHNLSVSGYPRTCYTCGDGL